MLLNKIKTVLLLTMLSGLFLLIGGFIGGGAGVTVALVFSVIMNVGVYFFSDQIVLHMYKAQPLDQRKYGFVYDIVSDLSKKMNLPMPSLWLIDDPMANAFATGRSPAHSAVAVTTGIMELLNAHELRAVLAHEMSHIQNRDILVSTIAATLATAIAYLAHMLQYMAFWQSSSQRDDRKQSANPIILFFIALIMPIAASIIQLAISRSREFLADETGAHSCQDPLALIDALKKLNKDVEYHHLEADTKYGPTSSLFIVNPFSNIDWSSLFSTHPPITARIKRLQEIHTKMFSSSE